MLVARAYEWQIAGVRDFCDFKQRQARGSIMHMHIDYPENTGLCTMCMFIAQENVEVEGAEEGRARTGVVYVAFGTSLTHGFPVAGVPSCTRPRVPASARVLSKELPYAPLSSVKCLRRFLTVSLSTESTHFSFR